MYRWHELFEGDVIHLKITGYHLNIPSVKTVFVDSWLNGCSVGFDIGEFQLGFAVYRFDGGKSQPELPLYQLELPPYQPENTEFRLVNTLYRLELISSFIYRGYNEIDNTLVYTLFGKICSITYNSNNYVMYNLFFGTKFE